MPSKQKDVAKSNISPVLFLTEDGEPMTFFLRPGHVKRRLQPLITAGAGMLCSVQQPGAILLIDPEERDSISDSTAHWYVSTQYVLDCVEKNEQLDLEDYRLNPEVVPKQSARLKNNNNKDTSLSAGRAAYTSEDDAAILSYVSKRIKEVGGNRLWQEMEKERVTSHSWQSMKYRYKVRLAKKQPEDVEVEDNQETDVQKPSSAEDAASPQTHSADSDQTQIDAQSTPAKGTEPDNVEAQTSISPQEEVQHVKPQTDEQPAESTPVETAEAETSNSHQPEAPCLDPQTDAESTKPETDEAQTIISPCKQSVPEDFPPAQLKSLRNTSSQKKIKEKQKASPQVEQPQRRVTRRQLVLDELLSPGPYAKKLRSSTLSPGRPSSSPQPSKKTKSAVKSALQKDTTVEQPSLKRARKSVAESPREGSPQEESPEEGSPQEESPEEESPEEASPEEASPEEESPEEESPEEASPREGCPEEGSPQEESPREGSGRTAASETAQADTGSNPVPQKGEKKKEKRKFGILELATKEFEDESESDEDGTPDLQNPTETVTIQPASKEPSLPAAEREPTLQENLQESQASGSNSLPKTGCPEPAATKAVSAPNKAHLFIFDSESQEEESQSIVAAPSKPRPTVNKDAALSLTQVQLEEDKQLIRELMKQTNQDLISVTKALLRTSGDFSAALEQLLNPSSISGPLWNRRDDSLLLSADPAVRQQLQEKYSEEDVAKRIVFLEVQG